MPLPRPLPYLVTLARDLYSRLYSSSSSSSSSSGPSHSALMHRIHRALLLPLFGFALIATLTMSSFNTPYVRNGYVISLRGIDIMRETLVSDCPEFTIMWVYGPLAILIPSFIACLTAMVARVSLIQVPVAGLSTSPTFPTSPCSQSSSHPPSSFSRSSSSPRLIIMSLATLAQVIGFIIFAWVMSKIPYRRYCFLELGPYYELEPDRGATLAQLCIVLSLLQLAFMVYWHWWPSCLSFGSSSNVNKMTGNGNCGGVSGGNGGGSGGGGGGNDAAGVAGATTAGPRLPPIWWQDCIVLLSGVLALLGIFTLASPQWSGHYPGDAQPLSFLVVRKRLYTIADVNCDDIIRLNVHLALLVILGAAAVLVGFNTSPYASRKRICGPLLVAAVVFKTVCWLTAAQLDRTGLCGHGSQQPLREWLPGLVFSDQYYCLHNCATCSLVMAVIAFVLPAPPTPPSQGLLLYATDKD